MILFVDKSLGSDNFFKYHEQEVVVVEKGEFPATIKEAFYRSKLDNGKIIGKGTIIRLRIIDRTIGGNGFVSCDLKKFTFS